MVHQNELTKSDNISSFAREHVLKLCLINSNTIMINDTRFVAVKLGN